jgi:hypothetical protein
MNISHYDPGPPAKRLEPFGAASVRRVADRGMHAHPQGRLIWAILIEHNAIEPTLLRYGNLADGNRWRDTSKQSHRRHRDRIAAIVAELERRGFP